MNPRRRIMRVAFVCAVLMTMAGAATGDESQFGSWGFDLSAIDSNTPPGESFFAYANGSWVARTQIPKDRGLQSLRLGMTEATIGRIRSMLETASLKARADLTDGEHKAAMFFSAFMDEARLEALGAEPLGTRISEIRQASGRKALGALMGRSNFDFVGTFFGISIEEDPKLPSQYVATLSQAGLGLPSRDYYLLPAHSKIKDAYRRHVQRILELIEWPAPERNASEILQLEERIARVSWPDEARRDLTKMHNPMRLEQLEVLAPEFGWRAFLEAARVSPSSRLVVAEKSAFPAIATIFGDAPIQTLQAWMAFHAADSASPFLSKAFANAHFDLYRRELGGKQQQMERWKQAVYATAGRIDASDPEGFGTLRWLVGELYVNREFPPALRVQVEAMAANLMSAFRGRIDRASWLQPKTKREAIAKLERLVVRVGGPAKHRDHSALEIRRDDVFGNVQRAAEWEWMHEVKWLVSGMPRDEWSVPAHVNNGYYRWYTVDILLPAGLLQPPMFQAHADAAINYGALGAYLGHEITHAFDDQGREVDSTGNLRDWWTASDTAVFKGRAQKLVAQYSAFMPLKDDPNVRVNGNLTLGENIADLGGVATALHAYRISLAGKPAPLRDGFTGEQRFFLGWAQAWRSKVSPASLRSQIVTGPHAPRQFRVDGVVRNLDEWYAAYEIKPGAPLYIAPRDRVRIVGSSRVDLQACKLEYSIVSPK